MTKEIRLLMLISLGVGNRLMANFDGKLMECNWHSMGAISTWWLLTAICQCKFKYRHKKTLRRGEGEPNSHQLRR